ncbi:hypothetical protein [Gilliamella mensalis]|uniref:hypothetical protein n=1 Tax=Gilliamella mensalis TaxID=1908520 RepID=UPI000A14E509|nr:hypothetical protein [Gilliamella mensalis]
MRYYVSYWKWQPYVFYVLRYHSSRLFSLILLLSSKVPLALMFLFLLPYSSCSRALSAYTSSTIQGTAPYFMLDGGKIKASTTEDLLSITLSDGQIITPKNNPSSHTKPIELPDLKDNFSTIGMVVPTTTNSIEYNQLIDGTQNNYWAADDDGDGQEVDGITATGTLTVNITDKYGHTVGRHDVLRTCNAPYQVELSSSVGSLSTKYGIPNSRTFWGNKVTYYITPKPSPIICYLATGSVEDLGNYAGPAYMWEPSEGFIPQSFTPKSYNLNFPTTGANGLYFYLKIEGVGPLTWPSTITKGGITVTTKPNSTGSRVLVTLTGPVAEQTSSPIVKPALPQKFELLGKDSSGKVILTYGFELNKWFVSSGSRYNSASGTATWCSNLGYRLTQVRDLTNAICDNSSGLSCEGSVGATPSSSGNNYHRRIAGGFFSEWGAMDAYPDSEFEYVIYWTSDISNKSKSFGVSSYMGFIVGEDSSSLRSGICVYP